MSAACRTSRLPSTIVVDRQSVGLVALPEARWILRLHMQPVTHPSLFIALKAHCYSCIASY